MASEPGGAAGAAEAGASEADARAAALIVDHLTRAGARAGDRLPEQRLADALGVSRTPVRRGLAYLRRHGLAKRREARGYLLAVDAAELAQRVDPPTADEEERYIAVAADRLAGRLPETVAEADLVRRYAMTRSEARALLQRMVGEGWVERRRGYGWRFLEMFATQEAYEQSYRFRMAIEPAALLEPGYQIDRQRFAEARASQEALLVDELRPAARAKIFQLGSDFHELIVGCSGNVFFLEALRRQNRLRRLIEYQAMGDRAFFAAQCREHLVLLDLIETGRREEAADFLRRHLDVAMIGKARLLTEGADAPAIATPF